MLAMTVFVWPMIKIKQRGGGMLLQSAIVSHNQGAA